MAKRKYTRRKATRRVRKPREKAEVLVEVAATAVSGEPQALTITQRLHNAEIQRDTAKAECEKRDEQLKQAQLRYDNLLRSNNEQSVLHQQTKTLVETGKRELEAARSEVAELRRQLGIMEGYIQRSNEDELIAKHGVAEVTQVVQRREGPTLSPRWRANNGNY